MSAVITMNSVYAEWSHDFLVNVQYLLHECHSQIFLFSVVFFVFVFFKWSLPCRLLASQLELASTCPQLRGNSKVVVGSVKVRGGMWSDALSLAPRFHADERSMATAKRQEENIF